MTTPVSKTRSGKYYSAKNTRKYFENYEDLKRVHRRLFSPHPQIDERKRGIVHTPWAFNEKTIRIPFDYQSTESLIKKQVLTFLNSGKGKRAELCVTANIVLANLQNNSFR